MIFSMITPTHPLIVTGGTVSVSSTASNTSWQKRDQGPVHSQNDDIDVQRGGHQLSPGHVCRRVTAVVGKLAIRDGVPDITGHDHPAGEPSRLQCPPDRSGPFQLGIECRHKNRGPGGRS